MNLGHAFLLLCPAFALHLNLLPSTQDSSLPINVVLVPSWGQEYRNLSGYLIFFFLLFSFRKLKTAVQSTSPLIILGFSRLLSTKGVDYQVKIFQVYKMTL